jgi:Caspase domain
MMKQLLLLVIAYVILSFQNTCAANVDAERSRDNEISQCKAEELYSWGDGEDYSVDKDLNIFVYDHSEAPIWFEERFVLSLISKVVSEWSKCGVITQPKVLSIKNYQISEKNKNLIIIKWARNLKSSDGEEAWSISNLSLSTLYISIDSFVKLKNNNSSYDSTYTLQMTISHELGHFHGLMDHSRRCIDVMSYYSDGKGGQCYARDPNIVKLFPEYRSSLPTACDIQRCQLVNSRPSVSNFIAKLYPNCVEYDPLDINIRNAENNSVKKLSEVSKSIQTKQNVRKLDLKISSTSPTLEGDFTINIQTNADTASLKLNGDEQGGKADGNYSIKRVARAGQTSTFTVIAKDVFGNTDTKTLSVTRAIADSSNNYAALNPALIKNRASPDAVAIIIGIQNYRRIPKADFASDDAKDFYDYAIRALGIKPENIKLLVDEQADDVEILATFQSWLPVKVRKKKSDVYVFYSGHGLPSEDGKNLYFLPYGTDKQYLDRTALNQQTIVTAIQAAQPKSVTMFIDACYSGQSRTGETLLASARPISIKQSASSFPSDFTIFSASAPDQLSSSSPDLKHGVFSYYLMKGMEGDADENHDGKITNSEMQNYLRDMVSRQALTLNRKQEPQLMGDAGKVLVGR